ncbi:Rv1733c family protein [Streptomyces dysideae]|uniref:Proline rich protein membrane protein n=1 Tax=Streptomyces dysideae TaxID=909626 RepID=A0A101UW14_9ACTN|nr:hypothetical protein [Streptomyces dysideae]KUO17816.1 hypothetical protein AQJ91_28715 [Streptomyces dysideae]
MTTGAGRRGWRFRRSPLRRRSYLVEAWLLLATWTLALVAAVVSGVLIAHAVERNMNGLRSERHTVPAVLTEDAELPVSATEGADGDRAWATVRWTGADGAARTGVARVEPGSRAGSTARVWLDAKDRLVPEPATADQAELQGAVLGTAAAVGAGAAVVLLGRAGCAGLNRRRLAHWDKEWAAVGPQWGRRTG